MCFIEVMIMRTIVSFQFFIIIFFIFFSACQPTSQSSKNSQLNNHLGSSDSLQKEAEAEFITTSDNETKSKKMMRGIDVSHFCGKVDWQKVKDAGYRFAFAKATEGVDLKDPSFDLYWGKIKEMGLKRGAYHFYVTEDDPTDQANFFIQNVSLQTGDFLPTVDIEHIGHGTKPGLVERLKIFLGILENHFGVKPMVYTSRKFWNSHLNDHFNQYPLWIAEYGVETPTIPKGWKVWHIWQWKENAVIPGVEKSADLNVFNQKEKDFSSLLLQK